MSPTEIHRLGTDTPLIPSTHTGPQARVISVTTPTPTLNQPNVNLTPMVTRQMIEILRRSRDISFGCSLVQNPLLFTRHTAGLSSSLRTPVICAEFQLVLSLGKGSSRHSLLRTLSVVPLVSFTSVAPRLLTPGRPGRLGGPPS